MREMTWGDILDMGPCWCDDDLEKARVRLSEIMGKDVCRLTRIRLYNVFTVAREMTAHVAGPGEIPHLGDGAWVISAPLEYAPGYGALIRLVVRAIDRGDSLSCRDVLDFVQTRWEVEAGRLG